MTERARRRRRRALARAPARVRTGARRVCFAHLVMRSPRTRVAPALTRALPPSRNRVFTGRHLRLYRQDRDRAHRARQAPHPDPGCQPQGAPPPQLRTKRRTEKPRLPACAFEPIAPSRSRDRARDARRGAKCTRDAREEHVPRSRAHTCPSRSPAPPPRVRDRGGGDATVRLRPPRKDGGDAFPVSAARERRFRASHLAVARQIFGDLSCRASQSRKKWFRAFSKKVFFFSELT